MAENAEFSARIVQRFEFIEWRSYWVGRLNRRDLENEFGISTQQASLDIRNYQTAAPGNLDYDGTEKTYVATAHFKPKFHTIAPERYLLQLQAIKSGAIKQSDTWFDQLPTLDALPTIGRGPNADIVRAILRAIDAHAQLKINYQSWEKAELRTILPHSIAHDGFRWHVRAWSLESQKFRDFVFNRILSVSPQEPAAVTPPEDVQWETVITLKLRAHPELSEVEKATVECDFQLKDGYLEIPIRAALAFYFVRRHNLDLRDGQIKPLRSQLYLENFAEYEAALKETQKRENLIADMHKSAADEAGQGSSAG